MDRTTAVATVSTSRTATFPALTGNANGQRVMTYYSYRMTMLHRLKMCDIRDEHGDLVHVTPTNGGKPSPAG